MGKLTLSWDDELDTDVYEAFAKRNGYQEILPDRTRNPLTKAEFLEKTLIRQLIGFVKEHRVSSFRTQKSLEVKAEVERIRLELESKITASDVAADARVDA